MRFCFHCFLTRIGLNRINAMCSRCADEVAEAFAIAGFDPVQEAEEMIGGEK